MPTQDRMARIEEEMARVARDMLALDYGEYVERKEKKHEKPLSREEWAAKNRSRGLEQVGPVTDKERSKKHKTDKDKDLSEREKARMRVDKNQTIDQSLEVQNYQPTRHPESRKGPKDLSKREIGDRKNPKKHITAPSVTEERTQRKLEKARERTEKDKQKKKARLDALLASLDGYDDTAYWQNQFIQLDKALPRYNPRTVSDFNKVVRHYGQHMNREVSGAVAHWYHEYRSGSLTAKKAVEELVDDLSR